MPTNEKIIAVWGSPHAGKTAFAVKFAENLYQRTRGAVVVLHCDLLTPTLPILFPNAREQDLFSVGTVLAKPNIFRGDIVSNLVTVKERQNLGFLGYRTGENRYSFPTFGRVKVTEFFAVLSDLADSIVVDCTSDPESNLLTAVSLQDAGTLIRVSSPDLSSLSFFQSQTGAGFGTPKERTVSILNVRDPDTAPLASDFASHLGAQVILPYSEALREQSLVGTLIQPTKDRRYLSGIAKVTEAVIR